MSVKIRPYVTGGWEVDIRFRQPDRTVVRERVKSLLASKSAVQRWAGARERVLLVEGKHRPVSPEPASEEVAHVCNLREFATRFLTGYAKANRLKPSGIAAKETIFRVHLVPQLGAKPFDQISTEDVQALKGVLGHRAPKTVNNVLTVLSVALKTAVEWGVIERVPCAIRLLATPKGNASFYDFDEYARLVKAAEADPVTHLGVLLGGEAGLRCGEIMALEWKDVVRARRSRQSGCWTSGLRERRKEVFWRRRERRKKRPGNPGLKWWRRRESNPRPKGLSLQDSTCVSALVVSRPAAKNGERAGR